MRFGDLEGGFRLKNIVFWQQIYSESTEGANDIIRNIINTQKALIVGSFGTYIYIVTFLKNNCKIRKIEC